MNKKHVLSTHAIDNHSPETSRSLQWITTLMILTTLGGAFWAGLFPIRGSNDCWWHLKTGEYLWDYFQKNGWFHFPPYDVFTYTGSSIPWVNHEWLSDLFFYWAYALGGIQGAIILKSLVLTLAIALLLLYMVRNGVGWKMACMGSLMILFASQTSIDLRPPVFTYLFVAIFLHLILCFQLDEYVNWAFVGAIVSQILWINLHGGAVIGIILLFFWWLSECWFCIVTWLHENPTAPSFKRLSTATFIFAAVSLSSFINPFTYHVHLLPFKVMNDTWLVSVIGELQSANMHYTNSFELIILGLFFLPMLRAGSIWVYEGLAIVYFGHQALNYMRHIPLFAIVAVPPLISALAEERRVLIPRDIEEGENLGFWGILCASVKWLFNRHVDVVVAFLVIAYVFGMRPGKIWERNYKDYPSYRSDGYVRDTYPVDAVNFIERYRLAGPMFNHDNFAGFLIWRLAPEKYQIFTDSRYDLWGSIFAKEELAILNAREIPLGGYDANGEWWHFNDLIKTKEQIQSLIYAGEFPEFVDLKEWFASDKPYWQYLLDDKYKINFLITYDIDPIQYYLNKKYLGWFLVCHEKGYVVYLRDDPKNDEILNKFAQNHREHLRVSGPIPSASHP